MQQEEQQFDQETAELVEAYKVVRTRPDERI